MKTFDDYKDLISSLLKKIETACGTLSKKFYLAGTTPVSLLHLKHAVSLDLDFHTKKGLEPTHEEAKILKDKLPNLSWYEVDRGFGIYRGLVKHQGIKIAVDLLSHYEDTPEENLQENSLSSIKTPNLEYYLKTKIQCLEERLEAKDLYHLFCLSKYKNKTFEEKIFHLSRKIDFNTLENAKKNFLEEWPLIKDHIRCVSGLEPLDETELYDWVLNLGKNRSEREKILTMDPIKKPSQQNINYVENQPKLIPHTPKISYDETLGKTRKEPVPQRNKNGKEIKPTDQRIYFEP